MMVVYLVYAGVGAGVRDREILRLWSSRPLSPKHVFRAFGAVLSRVFVVITQRGLSTAIPAFVDGRIDREVWRFRSHKKAWLVSERSRAAVDMGGEIEPN